jgi:ribosomal protein S18 acetylase RimI-like enzyme
MNFFNNQSQSSSSISIQHNSHFSFEDIESVLGPLFGNYYGTEQLRSMINKVGHIWGVYDRRIQRYTACALVTSHSKDNVLYIKLFGVEKSSQGQGIGTHLLEAIKTWGRKSDYFAIILHTQIDNTKAIGLYEKVGFRKQYFLKDFFRPRGLFSFIAFNEPDGYQMILYLL